MRKYPKLFSLTLSTLSFNSAESPRFHKNSQISKIQSIFNKSRSRKRTSLSLLRRDQKSHNLEANVPTKNLPAVEAEREMEAMEQGKRQRRRWRVEDHAIMQTETGEIRFHEVWEIGEGTKSSFLHHAEMCHYAYLLD